MNNFVNHLLAQKKRTEQYNQRVAEVQRAPAPRSRLKGLGGEIVFTKR
ncbi:hypothetical protein PARSHIK_85 [Erwinia phage vB_EamM_Parshik]|uniref:Uncharacterized protein n=1 Tax=Erwinia phage vB_EamM_Huxley TaxID=1883373 RepID=A0A1B2ID17_9CAUD|nr:hypothetical protein BIZ81_gp199 [Erwinia phage vB_EamM_Huxley]ANZ49166.1 hypothetical protein HUXLEY_84 [Erwinia phage vB_EamM_Huxley]ANZ49994.1 hypothetical protein PARSHIK_85 [Erwinia phage vB_EamM_Parshik]